MKHYFEHRAIPCLYVPLGPLLQNVVNSWILYLQMLNSDFQEALNRAQSITSITPLFDSFVIYYPRSSLVCLLSSV